MVVCLAGALLSGKWLICQSSVSQMWDSDYTEMLTSLGLPNLKRMEESPKAVSAVQDCQQPSSFPRGPLNSCSCLMVTLLV